MLRARRRRHVNTCDRQADDRTRRRSRLNLQPMAAATTSAAASAGAVQTLSLPQKIARAVKRAEFAMAQQDIRYYLNGMLLVIDQSSLQAVATDGHRLSWASLAIAGSYTRQEVILPRKTVLELGKLLGDSEDPVTIDVLANQVRFRFGKVELGEQGRRRQVSRHNRVIPTGPASDDSTTRAPVRDAASGDPSNAKIPRRATGARRRHAEDHLHQRRAGGSEEESRFRIRATTGHRLQHPTARRARELSSERVNLASATRTRALWSRCRDETIQVRGHADADLAAWRTEQTYEHSSAGPSRRRPLPKQTRHRSCRIESIE